MRIVHWGCWVALRVADELHVLVLAVEHSRVASLLRGLTPLDVRAQHVRVHVLDHCADVSAALEVLSGVVPDLVIVDVMPWGPRVITQLSAATRAPVLVVSAHPQIDHVLACIDAGAAGYVTDQLDATQWTRVLRDAVEGRAPFSADVGTLLLPLLRDRRVDEAPPVDLTDRERNVLGLLVHGHAYAAIADALGIGLGTVQSHVKNLYRKLDVCTKAEAATIALRHGLLSAHSERRRARALT